MNGCQYRMRTRSTLLLKVFQPSQNSNPRVFTPNSIVSAQSTRLTRPRCSHSSLHKFHPILPDLLKNIKRFGSTGTNTASIVAVSESADLTHFTGTPQHHLSTNQNQFVDLLINRVGVVGPAGRQWGRQIDDTRVQRLMAWEQEQEVESSKLLY